jgi:hypothetical protein
MNQEPGTRNPEATRKAKPFRARTACPLLRSRHEGNVRLSNIRVSEDDLSDVSASLSTSLFTPSCACEDL